MLLPLKPIVDDPNLKQLDSKQKKFYQNVEKALQNFDLVIEWADYISSLGRLLKALQSWTPQFQNVEYYVPFPYQVSRRLASALSPQLPSGVHQKALDVYAYIFDKIGTDTLGKECNIWLSGIFPLMSHASISSKSQLIDLYEKYIIQLPPPILRLLVRPMIASLLPGIDDESSEFQSIVMNLIDTLKENLSDDSLFWQTCFIIMITNKDRRLGGLVWLNKKLPSLNGIPHLLTKRKNDVQVEILDRKKAKANALSCLLPAAKDTITPDSGLLIRCLISLLEKDNELLIRRGVLDLLLQRIHLHSPVLQTLSVPSDRQLLIMSCCRAMLEKDMSLIRRIWSWMLGPSNIQKQIQEEENLNSSTDYFSEYGLSILLEGLVQMLKQEENALSAFKICLVLMDRWEIGSHIVPSLFIPLMNASIEYKENKQIMKVSSIFFDSVETDIIWGKIFNTIFSTNDFNILIFVLCHFNISTDEETVVHHLPLVLLSLMINLSKSPFIDKFELCLDLLKRIPERAYLPIQHLNLCYNPDLLNSDETLESITRYYSLICDSHKSCRSDISSESLCPFDLSDITTLIIKYSHLLVIQSLQSNEYIYQSIMLFIMLMEKVVEQNPHQEVEGKNGFDRLLVKFIFNLDLKEKMNDSIFGIINIYSNYLASRLPLIESLKLLNIIVKSLWKRLINSNQQLPAIQCLNSLQRVVMAKDLESSLAYSFIKEKNVTTRIIVLDGLWSQLENYSDVIQRPLEIVLDELFEKENSSYLQVSNWILSVFNSGSLNKLFQLLSCNLLQFSFIKENKLSEIDDLEIFTYRIQMLTNVLTSNDQIILKAFSTEQTSVQCPDIFKSDNISYKNLVISILLRFLGLDNNIYEPSIRSVVILFEHLINDFGTHYPDLTIQLLQLSEKYIKQDNPESELVTVSLLNTISKILSLSYEMPIKLDIFDEMSQITYIDFLVTGISKIKKPLVISAYIRLLSESIRYFDNTIFKITLPLSVSFSEFIERLFSQDDGKEDNFKSISLILDGLEKLLEMSHFYLLSDETNGTLSALSRNDFLQSVSNVFSHEDTTATSKVHNGRDVVLQSFKQAVSCSFAIWLWGHKNSNFSNNTTHEVDKTNPYYFEEFTHHQAFQYKFKSRKFIEKLFTMEPLEVLEYLIAEGSDELTITLIHVLDGNRPILTLPYLMESVISRCNKNYSVSFSNKLNTRWTYGSSMVCKMEPSYIMKFMINYIITLENTAMEDFHQDFIVFIREISNNYQYYDSISLNVLELIGIVSEKIHHSKFGECKKIRKDISDIFIKYLTTVLSEDLSTDINNSKTFEILVTTVEKLSFIVNDTNRGDKFNNCLSCIVSSILPFSRFGTQKSFLTDDSFMQLLRVVSLYGDKVKSWRLLLNELFHDETHFYDIIKTRNSWNQIFYAWSQYPENQEKLINDLINSISVKVNTMTPTINPFNSWNENEMETKCGNIKRISYLLMIAPNDTYIIHFKMLMNQIEQSLMNNDAHLKPAAFILLRCMCLKFSSVHFGEYWSNLTFILQMNLQLFYESLQDQEIIDNSTILQICKTLDLLIVLNIEEFTSMREWLFIVDTIHCIYKNNPYMSLIDEIGQSKIFEASYVDEIPINNSTDLRIPLLYGVRTINTYTSLQGFFHNVSYLTYEAMYDLKPLDIRKCEDDALGDILIR